MIIPHQAIWTSRLHSPPKAHHPSMLALPFNHPSKLAFPFFIIGQVRSQFHLYLDLPHGARILLIGSNDHVDVLNGTLEGLVHVLHLQLESQYAQVHLVHEEDRLDALLDGLTKHGLRLDTHTCRQMTIHAQYSM